MDNDHTASSRVGSTFGPYQLRTLLGRGGMGEVYEAFDTRRGRTVALKLLPRHASSDESYLQRFRRESQIAARLQEPHIVPIHDFGDIDGTLYLDMRLVRGEDLRALLKREGALRPERAVAIVAQIASALDAAHQDGLVHRDVKPENILLDPNDFAYLADFGIAASETDSKLTATGMAIGSYAYMAPERFDEATPTPAVDVYALGCVLYECLTGQKPFPRATVSALISAHMHEPPPQPSATGPGVPAALDQVVARALAKAPHQRFPTAGVLAQAATAALTGRSDTAPHGEATFVGPPAGMDPTAAVAVDPTFARPAAAPLPPTWAPPAQDTLHRPAYAGYAQAPYGQAAPYTQAPPQQRSGGKGPLVLVLALLGVLVLTGAAVGGVVLWQRGTNGVAPQELMAAPTSSEPAALPTTPATPPTTPAALPTTPAAPPRTVTVQAPADTVTVQVPAPTTATRATAARSSSVELDVSVPMTYPACDGMGIVVLYSAVTPGSYTSEVQGALNKYPGSRYLRTDHACPSLRQSLNGNPIYAVYREAGYSEDALCSAVNAAGGDAYGRWLDTWSDPTVLVGC